MFVVTRIWKYASHPMKMCIKMANVTWVLVFKLTSRVDWAGKSIVHRILQGMFENMKKK